ncbi:MAG: lactonase family protein [Halorhabdus sp.]
MTETDAYVGTYTDGESAGIYRLPHTGDDGAATLAAAADNPSYLAAHPSRDRLYAVNELDEGAVTAFSIDADGSLTELDRRLIGPADPCHCSVHPSGEYLFVAHYTGGSISVLAIDTDGRLGDPTVIDHAGSSVDPDRQASPHPHTIRPAPTGDIVYVADLGTDEIVRYDFEEETGDLQRAGATPLHDGAGPRQFDFGPDGRLYCINELDSTLSVFSIEDDGDLTHVETVATVPPEFDDENLPGAVAVHPSGAFVYGSNRGHDSVAVFEITADGLRTIQIESVRGEWPRDFAIDPSGKRLSVANADSDVIVPFDIDASTGRIDATGESIDVPDPVCVRPY